MVILMCALEDSPYEGPAIIQLISASLLTVYNAHGGARPLNVLNRPITVIFLPIFTHLTPGLKVRHPRRVLACNFYDPRALLAVLTLHCQPACETCSLEKVETLPRFFRRRGGALALPPGTISSRCSNTERKSQKFKVHRWPPPGRTISGVTGYHWYARPTESAAHLNCFGWWPREIGGSPFVKGTEMPVKRYTSRREKRRVRYNECCHYVCRALSTTINWYRLLQIWLFAFFHQQ